MDNDFTRRGYLLPDGCKDLIDTLKPKPHHGLEFSSAQHWDPAKFPPITGVLVITEQTTALDLAILMGQKPFQIIADIMQLGGFVTLTESLDFKIISRVAQKHGFIAQRAA